MTAMPFHTNAEWNDWVASLGDDPTAVFKLAAADLTKNNATALESIV
jgi:hypothetical protein